MKIKQKLKNEQTKKVKRKIKKAKIKYAKLEQNRLLIFKFVDNLHHFFPGIFDKLRKIKDFRTMPQYELAELVFAAIAMHLFKTGSRNAFNNDIDRGEFASNYFKAFKMSLPHMDTVDRAMRLISNDELETLKTYLVKVLIQKKIFYKYKIFGKHCNVSVDATGVMSINKANIKHFPNALYKIHNKGTDKEKKVYFLNVLEAKLVCSNGFCISLVTEWIENPEGEYKKQDCELKAFMRLAKKLKENFPRLSICIVGDGLYPNQHVFEICKKNGWEWIFTFKNGNLPSVWEEVHYLQKLQENNNCTNKKIISVKDKNNKIVKREFRQNYSWLTDIKYYGHKVHWVCLIETMDGEIIHQFVYLTNIRPSCNTVQELIKNGRLRFKIENEGFNTQKNLGYTLQHKFSQTSELATKNYYSCMQIAHLINQLFELQPLIRSFIKGRETFKSLWIFIKGYFSFENLSIEKINDYLNMKKQIRFT